MSKIKWQLTKKEQAERTVTPMIAIPFLVVIKKALEDTRVQVVACCCKADTTIVVDWLIEVELNTGVGRDQVVEVEV